MSKKRGSKLLPDERPLVVQKSLAVLLDHTDRALFLQQLHWWLNNSAAADHDDHFKDDRWWIWNSYREWGEQFPWWSKNKVVRTIDNLRDEGFIITSQEYGNPLDRRLWYSIDYDRLDEALSQFGLSQSIGLQEQAQKEAEDDIWAWGTDKKSGSPLLFDERPLVVQQPLALLLEQTDKALFLQQLHYWLNNTITADRQDHFQDDRWWVWNSYSEWQIQFPWWSKRKTREIIQGLRDNHFIVANYEHRSSPNQGLWYTINYDHLDDVLHNSDLPRTLRPQHTEEENISEISW